MPEPITVSWNFADADLALWCTHKLSMHTHTHTLCLSVCLSLSLSLTHTHTHTHTQRPQFNSQTLVNPKVKHRKELSKVLRHDWDPLTDLDLIFLKNLGAMKSSGWMSTWEGAIAGTADGCCMLRKVCSADTSDS